MERKENTHTKRLGTKDKEERAQKGRGEPNEKEVQSVMSAEVRVLPKMKS